QQDARLDLELDVRRPLQHVPAPDAVRQLADRVPGNLPRVRCRAGRLGAVEALGPLAHRVVAAGAHVVDDRRHPAIRSTGTTSIEEPPADSRRGRSSQTSLAGTSACTATIPRSLSG